MLFLKLLEAIVENEEAAIFEPLLLDTLVAHDHGEKNKKNIGLFMVLSGFEDLTV